MDNKPILFIDFDGVLCHDLFWRSLAQAQYQKIQKFLFSENPTLVNEWMVGKHTSEEINKTISAITGITYEYLWNIFVTDCKTMRVSEKVLQKIQVLRKRFNTILLTDNMDCFTRFTRPALQLDNHFDNISNSYEEGIRKIDGQGKIYIQNATKFDTIIRDCIVIDDSLKVCNLFTQLGGLAKLVTPEHDILYHLESL